jgi:biopolymer transport protein ExbD
MQPAPQTPKRRFIDVWLVESNTVYKEVPFAVVTDWVQQGRVLENDMWKPSGTRDWIPFGGRPEFAPYFPQPEPQRTEDQAEALEPVHVDFTFGRPKEPEDDDVDMIPLIDVSLVLLVFFMLSATTAGMAAFVRTPQVKETLMADTPDAFRIDVANKDGAPIYSLAPSGKNPEPEERDLRELAALMNRLRVRLEELPDDKRVEVVINADRELATKYVRDLLVALRAKPYRDKISVTYFGATQKR